MNQSRQYLFFFAAHDALGLAAKSHQLPGSIVRSQGRRYGDMFALTAQVAVPLRQCASFEEAVESLNQDAVAICHPIQPDDASQVIDQAPPGSVTVTIASFDRDQIVRRSCEAIANAQRSIVAYGGSRLSASRDGGALFCLKLVVSDGSEELLRASLEKFCDAHGAEYFLSDDLPLRGIARHEFIASNDIFNN